MWKSVKLRFFVNTNILEFFKEVHIFFMGFRMQFCFLTLEIRKYYFKQKSENYFLGEKYHF